MKKAVNILLIEDSKSYAQGMELLLNQHSKITNVFYASDYEKALDLLKVKVIDVVILDLNFETKQPVNMPTRHPVKVLCPVLTRSFSKTN